MVWGYIKSNGIRKLIKSDQRENYFAMVLPLTKFLIDEDIALLQAWSSQNFYQNQNLNLLSKRMAELS